MEIRGPWRAASGDDEGRRTFADPDASDDGWVEVAVPGHWRDHPDLADEDGPVFYRARFDSPAESGDPERRWWLTFDGIFYQADVWLNGAYVGDTEGYFAPHSFEVTDAIRSQTSHTLAVEVACAPERDLKAKRNICGVFQHWDCIEKGWNPGGIWRPVRLSSTGPVRLGDLSIKCTAATAAVGRLELRADLDSLDAGEVTVTTTVTGPDGETAAELVETHAVAAGANQHEWTIEVDEPALWWPHSMGEPNLHDVSVEVSWDGEMSDRAERRTGFRTVTVDDWIFTINGERLFIKGSNQGPARQDLANARPEDLRADVDRAVGAGLDLLRIHAHVARPETYEAADEAGLLLWQDFPLQWGYARSIRGQARRQAGQMASLLAHHPSVAIWCGHNEPMGLVDTEVPTETTKLIRLAGSIARHQLLPSWNRTVLDATVKRAIDRADGTRPSIAHSGVWPHPPQLSGTDSHLYFGWYHGDERDLPTFAKTMPRMVRFVSEFGAQAVPDDDHFIDADAWPDLDWERLRNERGLQHNVFERVVPPAEFESYLAWKDATQRYQAQVIRHHIETLRRLKYRPAGGFCHFSFADSYPSVSWSVLDAGRQPKPGLEALAAACAPVLVVADRLPRVVDVGSRIAVDVHVISDLRERLGECRVDARLMTPSGPQEVAWSGDIEADSVTYIGTTDLPVGDAAGAARLELSFRSADRAAANAYETKVSGDLR